MDQVDRIKRPKAYRGVVVPMITPFTAEGGLDEPAVRRVVDHLIAGGSHGVFVLGTTGENASIPLDMRARLVAITVEQAQGRAQVYAGISDNCLSHSVGAARAYADLGVDVVVAHLPSYFPLSGEEQRDYYLGLADRIDVPLFVYNIPSTTHMSVPLEVIAELRDHPRIVGLKDSEGDRARIQDVVQEYGQQDDFAVLIGVAAYSAWALGLGADGIVPSSGNLVPALCRSLYDLSLRGDKAGAERRQGQIDEAADLYRGPVSLARSLGRLKAAMGALELCEPHVLSPLPTPTRDEREMVRQQFLAWYVSQQS